MFMKSISVGFVVGGIMGCFLVLVLGVFVIDIIFIGVYINI